MSSYGAQGAPPLLLRAIHRAKLTAPDGAPVDDFGFSVAVSGDTAVVGAWSDDTAAGVGAGSAYVFLHSGNVWTLQAKLAAPDGAAGDAFGYSVAVDGYTVVVGAVKDDTSLRDTGSAYVFVRFGTAWIPQGKLTTPDGDVGDNFGGSVAISGDTAVVGADLDDSTGLAYVFVRSGIAWIRQARLAASDAAYADRFGYSVVVDGDTAVVGAFADDTPAAADTGSAYVFVRSGSTWSEEAKLTTSDGSYEDEFGISVAVDGDTTVVGAWLDDTAPGVGAGSAYVFLRSGTTWNQQAKLTASDAAYADRFGVSVSVDGDTAVVGADGHDTPDGTDAGLAYVFLRSGTTWTQQAKLTASDAAAGDYFGHSVAVSGDIAVVGAYGDDTPAGTYAGSAWVFWRSARSAPASR